MRRDRVGLVLPLLLGAFGLAGCGDDDPTGPGGSEFDPQAAAQAVAGLQAELDDDSDILMSLGLVGPALAAEGGAASMVVPQQVGEPVAPMAAQVVHDYVLSGGTAAPIFPSNLLGKTFTWSEGLGRYALSELAGAPANGVRFILYSINPLTGVPTTPLVEIGFLDLTDDSDAFATRLGVRAVSDGVALVDYSIEASFAAVGEDVSVTLVALGYVSDGSVQLDFDLSQTATISTASETISLDVTYDLGVAGQNASVRLNISGEFSFAQEGGPETATMSLQIQHGGDTAVMSAELAADNSLSGTISHNGAVVVVISGTEADPVFTRADGETLTAADVEALADLFGMIEDIFDFAENLFEPFDDGI